MMKNLPFCGWTEIFGGAGAVPESVNSLVEGLDISIWYSIELSSKKAYLTIRNIAKARVKVESAFTVNNL